MKPLKLNVEEAAEAKIFTDEEVWKIGTSILNKSFGVIDGIFRKKVVDVVDIVNEFDKENIDINEHPTS